VLPQARTSLWAGRKFLIMWLFVFVWGVVENWEICSSLMFLCNPNITSVRSEKKKKIPVGCKRHVVFWKVMTRSTQNGLFYADFCRILKCIKYSQVTYVSIVLFTINCYRKIVSKQLLTTYWAKIFNFSNNFQHKIQHNFFWHSYKLKVWCNVIMSRN